MLIRFTVLFLYLLTALSAQPDARFRAFDWVVYRGAGEINSLTEGHQFIYIASSHGGLLRFNIFSEQFEEPITMAQGLGSYHVTATHFDRNTGVLWVATPDAIQYTFSLEGDWFSIDMSQLGLFNRDRITQIGSSSNYVWLKANASYVKISQSSGTLVGIFPVPDEIEIEWSSGRYIGQQELHSIFSTYDVMDGWIIHGNEFVDPLGRRVNINTGLIGKHNTVFAGTSDGTFFYASTTMKTFYPMSTGISNIDISALTDDGEEFWIGSYDYISSKGISVFHPRSNATHTYLFEETINMNPMPVYSISYKDNEVWAGGNGIVLYHDSNKNYWRTFGGERGIPNGTIWDMETDSSYVWLASNIGLNRIDRDSKREEQVGIEHLFYNRPVYDIELIEDQVWIGTQSGVYVFDPMNPLITSGVKLGLKDFPELFTYITSIEEYDSEVFIAGEMGIAKFTPSEREWNLLFPSAIYHAKTIYSMAVNNNHIFIGTDSGLSRIHKKTGFTKDYNYDFIGKVNDIILDDKTVWLGTNSGLIKFNWKRDI